MKNENDMKKNSSFKIDDLEWIIPAKDILLEIPYYGVYISDLSKRVLFWNKGAELLTGYSYAEAANHPSVGGLLGLSDLKGNPLHGPEDPLEKCVTHGERTRHKTRVTTKSGRKFTAQIHFLPVRDGRGEPTAGMAFFHDISEEEDLRQVQTNMNRTLQKYVSKATYREALIGSVTNQAPQPEFIDRTILFIDMVNFTAYSEKTDPAEVIRTLNELLGLGEEAVRECGGDVDKFVGDSMVAVFAEAGAALRAALQIRAGLAELNFRRGKRRQSPVEVRVGINSGRLIRGEVGSLHRKELAVVGDVVNTAARVQSMASPGEILITQATYDLVKRGKDFSPVGEMALKGKQRPVSIYRYGGLSKDDPPWIAGFLGHFFS